MAEKLVKCRYCHCKHPEDRRPPEEMIRGNGFTYYHAECAKERDLINRIVEYYTTNVDDRVTIAQLRSVVNNIIFKKKVPAEELLFDLTYVHQHGSKINSPYSLHYIISNKKVQNEYKKYLETKAPIIDISSIETSEETQFIYNKKKTGFGDIF